MYISKQQDFEDFLKLAKKQDVVAIDTEFLREKTYWPKLCLLQLAIKDKTVLVDPFEVDIMPISSLLLCDKVVKLFHSPRQDIEILFNETGVIPNNIFDTQIAAGFLGHNSQIGYANLVAAEMGIKLNKNDTYSDWSVRPLAKSQLEYAKNDVKYLLEIYYIMKDKLLSLKRYDWACEDIAQKYLDPKIYEVNPDERFWHLKHVSSLKKWQLACAKELASWRESCSIKKNIPRKWVISDEQIILICRKQPKNIDELFSMRGIKSSINIQEAREIIGAIKKGCAYKESDLPNIKECQKNSYKNDKCVCEEIEAEIDLMCAIIRHRAKEYNISPHTLSSNSDLSKIARGIKSGIPTLSGWRKKIVGNELLSLMDGKIELSISDGSLNIKEISKTSK